MYPFFICLRLETGWSHGRGVARGWNHHWRVQCADTVHYPWWNCKMLSAKVLAIQWRFSRNLSIYEHYYNACSCLQLLINPLLYLVHKPSKTLVGYPSYMQSFSCANLFDDVIHKLACLCVMDGQLVVVSQSARYSYFL